MSSSVLRSKVTSRPSLNFEVPSKLQRISKRLPMRTSRNSRKICVSSRTIKRVKSAS